jgi:hypothetical protein
MAAQRLNKPAKAAAALPHWATRLSKRTAGLASVLLNNSSAVTVLQGAKKSLHALPSSTIKQTPTAETTVSLVQCRWSLLHLEEGEYAFLKDQLRLLQPNVLRSRHWQRPLSPSDGCSDHKLVLAECVSTASNTTRLVC